VVAGWQTDSQTARLKVMLGVGEIEGRDRADNKNPEQCQIAQPVHI